MWRQGASQAMLHAVGMTPEDLNKAQARFFVTGSAEIYIPKIGLNNAAYLQHGNVIDG